MFSTCAAMLTELKKIILHVYVARRPSSRNIRLKRNSQETVYKLLITLMGYEGEARK
jgi:hypothetical protein